MFGLVVDAPVIVILLAPGRGGVPHAGKAASGALDQASEEILAAFLSSAGLGAQRDCAAAWPG